MNMNKGKFYLLESGMDKSRICRRFVGYAENGDDVVMEDSQGVKSEWDCACVVRELTVDEVDGWPNQHKDILATPQPGADVNGLSLYTHWALQAAYENVSKSELRLRAYHMVKHMRSKGIKSEHNIVDEHWDDEVPEYIANEAGADVSGLVEALEKIIAMGTDSGGYSTQLIQPAMVARQALAAYRAQDGREDNEC